MWRLCCPYLFLISYSVGTSGGLCFVTAAFPEYLHLRFCLKADGIYFEQMVDTIYSEGQLNKINSSHTMCCKMQLL